ncbi:MAG TPA: hypothetical protein VI752_01395 [Candidatus Paceibacterota bacterium]
MKPIKFIFNSVIFISSIVTIFGVISLVPQVRLVNRQLEEISSQPVIKINFNLLTSTLNMYDPVDIVLTVKNEGNRVASYWRGSLVFCKDINVESSGELWTQEQGVVNQYLIESKKVIPPTFPGKLKFYSYSLDNIGHFKISLPNKDGVVLEKPIPIGQVTISGDYNNPVSYLVLLSYPEGFIYENLLQENGYTRGDFVSKLSECFNIDSKIENNINLVNH